MKKRYNHQNTIRRHWEDGVGWVYDYTGPTYEEADLSVGDDFPGQFDGPENSSCGEEY